MEIIPSVYSDGVYGVLFIANSEKITCATCRYGKTSCVHVKHLASFCRNFETELPDVLLQYNNLLQLQLTAPHLILKKHYPDYSCFSKKKIPFQLSNEMSKVLQMPVNKRFNIITSDDDDAMEYAMLLPNTVSCGQCNNMSWGEPIFSNKATIVTSNQLIAAKGANYIRYAIIIIHV